MKLLRWTSGALLALQMSVPLAAQAEHPLGVQLRLGLPVDHVAEATGRKAAPGASLQVELDLDDGYRWRVAAGADRWGYGAWDGQPGTQGQVTVVHVEVEGLKFLGPDLEEIRRGPYLLVGLRGALWNLATRTLALDLRTSRRTTHLAASLGVGYRVKPCLDLEFKGWYGHADPDFRGGAWSVGATFRF